MVEIDYFYQNRLFDLRSQIKPRNKVMIFYIFAEKMVEYYGYSFNFDLIRIFVRKLSSSVDTRYHYVPYLFSE